MDEREPHDARSTEGAISRRGLLAGAAALGIACAFGEAPASAFAAPAADTPRKGGLLRLGLAGGAPGDGLDPGAAVDSVMIVVGRGLYDGLVELGADGRPAPELASAWEARPGAAEWVFTLRKGVRFSSGQEFTADDAIHSLNLRRGDGSAGAGRLLRAVRDIRKLDRHQIQIGLAGPDADFPAALTDHRLPMVPELFSDWSKPVGTGAFALEAFEPGVRVALKRAGDYWKDGRGHLDAAEITVIGDWSERLDALVSGRVDIINRVDPRAAGLLAKAARTEIVRAAGGWHAVMAMAVDRPPYDNPDLRLALKYAIDREQIVRALLNGYGAAGNDHPIPAGDPYFNKDLPQRKRDPDRAAYHLRRAGLDPAIALQASEAAFAGAVDVALQFQASAAKAGLKFDVRKEPVEGFWERIWLKGPFVESCWAGRAAATQILADVYRAGAPLNETRWSSEKFEGLLAIALVETDEAKRRSAIADMQTLLHDEGGAIIPVFRDWLDARHDLVGGVAPHGGFELGGGAILEKAFLKA
ncbi:MAG: ABC transporter substrate-binding protein [Roseiarcus sp.]